MPALSAAADGIREELRQVHARDIPAAKVAATQLIFRHYASQCLFTFAEIGAADAMGGEELTPMDIAVKIKT